MMTTLNFGALQLALTEDCTWSDPNEPNLSFCQNGRVYNFVNYLSGNVATRPCPRCKGKGTVLTEAGVQLIEFVRAFAPEGTDLPTNETW